MAIFMFFVGTVLVIGCTWLLIYNKFVFTKNALVVKGTIIDFDSSRMTNGSKTYKPIIEYICEGQVDKFVSNMGRPTKKSLGRTVDVYIYKKNNCKIRREEKNKLNQYIGPSILLTIGLLLVLFNSMSLF